MTHYIICKWKDKNAVTPAMLDEIGALFGAYHEVEGVQGVQVVPNCVNRDNRFDLMIRIRMEKEALLNWDASRIHHEWKEKYGDLIEKKTIFDEE